MIYKIVSVTVMASLTTHKCSSLKINPISNNTFISKIDIFYPTHCHHFSKMPDFSLVTDLSMNKIIAAFCTIAMYCLHSISSLFMPIVTFSLNFCWRS